MPDRMPREQGHAVPGRSSRPLVRLALLLMVLLAAVPGAAVRGQERDPADDGDAAEQETPVDAAHVASVVAGLETRQRILADLLVAAGRGYRKVAIERGAVQQELASALEKLDREAVRARELGRERLEQLQDDVDRARLRLVQLLDETNRRLDEMRRLVGERDEIARRVASLRGRVPQRREPLTGTWEVTWMPAGHTGTFFLDQSGTLVTGQYKLGPAGSGSVQGTFVGGKLFLQRIDAQRGRDAEIEGVLDPDGTRIRGTWQNYEMVHGGLPRGTWTARRVR